MESLAHSNNRVIFEPRGSTVDGQHERGSNALSPVRDQRVQLPETSQHVVPQSQDSDEWPTISTLCSDCLRRYQSLCDELCDCTVEKSSQHGFDRDLSLGLMHDARSRFKAWATNIAATHPSHFHSSLDFRLKEAAEIRTRILRILDDLRESLHAALQIVSGVEPNETWGVDDISDISDSDEEDGGVLLNNRDRTSELEELFSAVNLANASLLKLSVVIRSSPARDDYLKAATRYKLDPRWDIGHVTEKHGSAKGNSQWLIERLGKAITRRRQYLKYRKEHHGKLSKDWEEAQKADAAKKEDEEDEKPEHTVAPTKLTKATTYVENPPPPGKDGSDAGGSFGSQTSYEPTMAGEATMTITRLTVPPHPTMAFEDVPFEFGKPFQCPYCYTEQTVKNKTAWKKHVFHDLKPYVCTFKECDLRMFRSRNEWFAHELQNHRREWTCQFCQRAPFVSKAAFSKHLTSQHYGIVDSSQIEALVLQSEEPVDKVVPSACHLCDEWETSLLDSNQDSKRSFLNAGKKTEPYGTLKQFRRHLGRHMEQLALFSLPLNEDEEMEDESAESEDQGSHQSGIEVNRLEESKGQDLESDWEDLDANFCRNQLTSYCVYTIRKVGTEEPEKSTWARAEILQEEWSQKEIANRVEKLNESGRPVAEKKASLMLFQQGQVNKLLDELSYEESDPNFAWSLVQLDKKERELKLGMRGTTVIYVYVRRAPYGGLDPVIHARNTELNRRNKGQEPRRASEMSVNTHSIVKRFLSGHKDLQPIESIISSPEKKEKNDEEENESAYSDLSITSVQDNEAQARLDSESVHTSTKAGEGERILPIHDSITSDSQLRSIDKDLQRSAGENVGLDSATSRDKIFGGEVAGSGASPSASAWDLDSEHEDIPDLFRKATMGMFEPGREEDSSSDSVAPKAATGFQTRDYEKLERELAEKEKWRPLRTTKPENPPRKGGFDDDGVKRGNQKLKSPSGTQDEAPDPITTDDDWSGFMPAKSKKKGKKRAEEPSTKPAADRFNAFDEIKLDESTPVLNLNFGNDGTGAKRTDGFGAWGSSWKFGSNNAWDFSTATTDTAAADIKTTDQEIDKNPWSISRGKRKKKATSFDFGPDFEDEAQAEEPGQPTEKGGEDPFGFSFIPLSKKDKKIKKREAEEAKLREEAERMPDPGPTEHFQASGSGSFSKEPRAEYVGDVPSNTHVTSLLERHHRRRSISPDLSEKEDLRLRRETSPHPEESAPLNSKVSSQPRQFLDESGQQFRGEPQLYQDATSKLQAATAEEEDVDQLPKLSNTRKAEISKEQTTRERRKPVVIRRDKPSKSKRPPPSFHENRASPKLSIPRKEDPSHFGIPNPTTRAPPVVNQPIPVRPRAITSRANFRPLSYHAAYSTGPPLAASAYSQPPRVTPAYPPPSPSYMRYAATPSTNYFTTPGYNPRPLASRFEPIPRTSSAEGIRDRTATNAQIPSERVNPIPRTSSADGIRKTETPQAFKDGFDAGYYGDRDGSAGEPVSGRRPSIRMPSRPIAVITPAQRDYEAMPPTLRPGILRRGDASDYESRVRQATSYQEDVGRTPVPLTAEFLRRQQRREAGSGRSTESSISRDESDYRKSATTRTTRSGTGPDDENVTIKITGNARVMIGGAQVDATDGGEINILRRKSIRDGSERANADYGGGSRIDDRRSRDERPPGRARASSQHSNTRSTPQYPMGDYI